MGSDAAAKRAQKSQDESLKLMRDQQNMLKDQQKEKPRFQGGYFGLLGNANNSNRATFLGG